jgi:predicted RNA-binding Zn-ribbon protein involved in translation (DUF1610 family)
MKTGQVRTGGAKRGKRGGKNRKKKKRRGGRPGQPQMGPPRRRPKSHCVCTTCGAKVPLYTEVPCYVMSCPKCGLTMTKESKHTRPVDDDSQPPNI